MRTSKLAVSLILGKLAATTAQGPYSCGDVSEPWNVIEGKYDLKLLDIHEMKHDRIIMVDISLQSCTEIYFLVLRHENSILFT